MRNSIILLNKKNSEQTEILNPAIIVYSNAETDKLKILSNNKGLSGIYQWKHNESGKIYIGSAVDLSKRLNNYYTSSYLTRPGNSYIYNALINYEYSAFSLSILEYLDIANLSKNEARKLLIEREQFYIDTLNPKLNILKVAGSSYGYKHTEESLELIRIALKGRSFTKIHLEKLSKAKKGVPLREDHKLKLSKKIYVYTNENPKEVFLNFNSVNETAEYFNCSRRTISSYIDSNKLYKKNFILSSSCSAPSGASLS